MIDVSALYLARLEFMLYSYLMIQTFIHPVSTQPSKAAHHMPHALS